MSIRVHPASRNAEHHQPKRAISRGKSAVAAMYAGLTASVIATIYPYIDRATSNTLAGHIRAGYPSYTEARTDTAVTTYLVYLSIIGALGVVGWLFAVHAVKTGKRWARGVTTAMFVLGASVALTDLLIKDTSGDTGLPSSLGWVGVLPCLPGLLAVALLWRRQ